MSVSGGTSVLVGVDLGVAGVDVYVGGNVGGVDVGVAGGVGGVGDFSAGGVGGVGVPGVDCGVGVVSDLCKKGK
ncbi:hypothetical protein A3A46_00885 [Candidatus Roizmanbacteria bacterium RIFCSPLOWO2_01_FULL_37_13]|uniref:Uncharacterized protein n=1 Tax=Candidatus Roizmanbacteria bacterium RIFCSPHIGHO2_02_FULL_38_11 TaxID=1802039 RepID=A0A1F7H263_9BACT|nr:MAG: hypothetical protein A3C25_02695 [Candidatus Roizmanbacteria bacterium RIFCSPHIGHO2_02_FULL_38_11]OGK41242.1 MAG: hypothetical protein A3A46_00885 [Candidatus Roizmanbacteria bacterium RIFCSPLOWO2_01_FULL_37_13]